MDRRSFLKAAALAGSGAPLIAAEALRISPGTGKPPRILYSNDTTNIMSCVSPWRNPKDGFTDEHLRQSIREAKGADIHMLQPGLGWIPWWDSKIYSPRDHYETFAKEHGFKPPAVARYLLHGGDMIRTLVDECRKLNVLPFVSYRLNDGHHVRGLAAALKQGHPTADMSRHYWENYTNYRIGPDTKNWDEGVFNWAIPEVREYKFRLIEEVCHNYEIAGLELDFLRHWNRFPKETPVAQRRSITTDFVSRIRSALDAGSRSRTRRMLCVRVPAKVDLHDDQGIHLPSLVEAGADLVNLSWSYFTFQDDSVRRAKKLVPQTPVYAEMTHTTMTGKAMAGSGTQPYLRTTDEQFYTTAHLAAEQGAAGVSLFNFQYYREHKMKELGPFTEPPFHVLSKLGDRDFLAHQPQWYFLTAARKDDVLGTLPLPALLQRNEPKSFTIELAPGRNQTSDGLLRLRSEEDISDRAFRVSLNGAELKAVDYVDKPLPHPYAAYLGTRKEHACFACPRSVVKSGTNKVEVTVLKGIRVKLIFVDLTLP